MTLPLIVALALGAAGVYIAYRNPQLGAAILVGLGIVTVLYVVWEKDPSVFQTGVPPASATVPAQAPPASETGAPSSGVPLPTPVVPSTSASPPAP
ncbi:hypothetical protein ACFV80_42475 [Streptomyces sp. NPDC059862]|uniref:hypothetical protein n=1 Tax=Streptomyces sp. NPDC059862 TaxID=3346975 RepID=UPI003669E324